MSTVLLSVCAAALMVFSKAAMQAALSAAEAFATGVMPALFPMMVLSRLLPACEGMVSAGLFAFCSGSPASAQRLAMLWSAGGLSPKRLETLAALTGVMSPLFFTGTLARWTGDSAACWKLLAVHWASALLTAAAWQMLGKASSAAGPKQPAIRAEPFLHRLPTAIAQAAQSILSVCGAMMLFSIAMALVRAALHAVFPLWTQAHARGLAVVWAMMEIGGGAAEMVRLFPTPPYAALGGLCAFGGLSIWMQNLLFAGQCIRPAKLLTMRMLHGAIAYGLGLMLF